MLVPPLCVLRIPAILVLSASLALPAPSQDAAEASTGLTLVAGKKVEGVVTQGKDWKGGAGFVECSGQGNVLESALEIGPGDFTIDARVTLVGIAESGAAFRLGKGDIVFGAGPEADHIVLRGGLFKKAGKRAARVLPNSAGLLRDRKAFDLTLRRGGETLNLLVNRKLVHSVKIGQKHVGRCAFVPGRATMRVHKWSMRARLRTKKRTTSREVLEMQPDIDRAIDTGVEWLLQAQNRDGSWSFSEESYRGGQTGLATYTLLKAGLPATHPAVERALAFLQGVRPDKTYSAACVMLALAATGDDKYRTQMKRILARLVKWQRGSFGYPHGRPDLSNTQYAALGFRAAHLAGLKVPTKSWLELLDATLKYQEPARMLRPTLPVRSKSGTFAMPNKVATAGFCYHPHQRKPTGSMTTAGISILAFCEQALGKRLGRRRASVRFAIDKGLRWMAKNFSVSKNPGKGGSWKFYYLYGVERVGGALDLEYIGDHHWYLDGARELLARQAKDGSWRQRDKEADTCFAILFLKRATRLKRAAITGGPRRRGDRHAAVDEKFEAQLRGTGSQHLALWVSGFSKSVLAEHKKIGLRVQRVEYFCDGEKLATVDGNPKKPWDGETFPTRHSFEKRGDYSITATVHVVDASAPLGAAEPLVTLENPGFTVEVPRILIETSKETIRPNVLAKLRKREIEAKGSSEEGKNKAALAVDGLQSTRWLCKKKDKAPALSILLDRFVRADTIVLRQPATRSLDIGVFDHIQQVELVLNRKDRFVVDMNPVEVEATAFPLGRVRKIRSLQVIVKKRKQGQKRGLAGFCELALEKRGK